MIKYDNSASLCKFLPRFLLHSRNVLDELWWLCLTHYHCHRNLNCFILWMHFDQSLPIMLMMLLLFSFRNFWKRANLLLSCFPLSEVPKPTNYLLFCRPTNPSFTTHRSQNLWELPFKYSTLENFCLHLLPSNLSANNCRRQQPCVTLPHHPSQNVTMSQNNTIHNVTMSQKNKKTQCHDITKQHKT